MGFTLAFKGLIHDMTSFKFRICAHTPVFLGTHLFKFDMMMMMMVVVQFS